MGNGGLPREYESYLTDRWQETAAAMSQLAGMMSTEKLLRSPDALPNGLGDMMRNSDKEKDILRHALQAGLGDRLFQQLNGQHTAQQFKADAAFLSEQTYMAQEACEQIVACFYCMLGWSLPVGGKPEPAPSVKPEPQPETRAEPESSPHQAPQPEIRPGEEISPYPQPQPEKPDAKQTAPDPELLSKYRNAKLLRNIAVVILVVASVANSGTFRRVCGMSVDGMDWSLFVLPLCIAGELYRASIGWKIEPNRTDKQRTNRIIMHIVDCFALLAVMMCATAVFYTIEDGQFTALPEYIIAAVLLIAGQWIRRKRDIGILR